MNKQDHPHSSSHKNQRTRSKSTADLFHHAPVRTARNTASSKRRPSSTPTGRNQATRALGLALVGIISIVLAEFASLDARVSSNLQWGALICTVLSVGAIFLALTAQRRRWRRRTRNRLVMGLPLAALNLLMLAIGYIDGSALSRRVPISDDFLASQTSTMPEMTARVQPLPASWYGEMRKDNVLLSASSFSQQAPESRTFNQRLLKPVGYARLRITNLDNNAPLILTSDVVVLHLSSGLTLKSLSIKPLLRSHPDNTALLKILSCPVEIPPGNMSIDLPICLPPAFRWDPVEAIEISLEKDTPYLLAGRVMTHEEQRALIEQLSQHHPSVNITNREAELWFKNF